MSNKTKIIVAVTLVLIVTLGTRYYMIKKESATASAVPASMPPDTVYITDDGFVPDTLKVKVGTEIVFLNKTNEWRWPASDLHPVHNLYPEFDPKTAIGPGAEWRFKFDKIGSWGMHDHLAPYIVGKIIVEE